jgi:hypothetical protein
VNLTREVYNEGGTVIRTDSLVWGDLLTNDLQPASVFGFNNIRALRPNGRHDPDRQHYDHDCVLYESVGQLIMHQGRQ